MSQVVSEGLDASALALIHPWAGLEEPQFFPLNVRDFRAENEDGALVFFAGDERIGPAEQAGLHALCGEIIQPKDFLEKLTPGLRAAIYNERFQAARDREVLAVLEGGRLTGLMSGGREVLPYRETAELVHATVAEVLGPLTVDYFSASSGGLHLRLLSDLVQPVTRAVGDALAAGIQVRQHYSGEQEVSLYMRRLICLNGMTATSTEFSWRNGEERSADHQRLWLRQGVASALESYQGVVDRARLMAETPVDGDAEEALIERARAMGVPRRHFAALRNAFQQEPDATEWGMANAITRVATHAGLPRDIGRRLQRTVGEWTQQFNMVEARMPRPVAERVGAHILRDAE